MKRWRWRQCWWLWLFVATGAWALGACGSDDAAGEEAGPPEKPAGDGGSAGAAGGAVDAGTDVGQQQDGALIEAGSGETCGAVLCPGSFKCRYDTCVPDLGTCERHDDCPGDSYCDAEGQCIPYGVPPSVVNDPQCKRDNPPEGVNPVVQCEWLQPAAGDPTEAFIDIYTAPVVADLNLDDDPGKLQPSVVVTTFDSSSGVRVGMLRVFDGRTCEEQLRLGGPDDPDAEANRPAYGTQWAIADLDGDAASGGRPEIIGMHNTGITSNNHPLNLYALKLDTEGGQERAEPLWYGRQCSAWGDEVVEFSSNLANYGPGVWDLDDDGVPEVIVDEMVFDAEGCLLSSFSDFVYLSHGPMSAVADVDLDGAPELVRFNRIAAWNTTTTEWEDESWFTPDVDAHKPGHVAVADLGQYSVLPQHPSPNDLPEIIVVSAASTTFDPNTSGTIRVQSLDGTVVWGPLELYHDPGQPGGHGGPPTASDFDGDGQVEFAAAANQYYAVYDPDCVEALQGQSPPQRPGGQCERHPSMNHLPDGILWAQPSQDYSSSGTGSSIFDFDGDGAAEAVYADECYVRVYQGATGQVVFSAPASSGTGFELPVIADVDGDFATEIVVARSVGPDCPLADPLFEGATGFEKRGGFAVLRDPEDRWAASRPIWNQHAYSITNVADDGTVPRSSEWKPNWTQPGLNNFRQNTQGDLGRLNIADLTVVFRNIDDLCQGQSGTTTLEAKVCNRGTNPVQDGVLVQFREGDQTLVCETATTRLLEPGQCEDVSCTGQLSGQGDVLVAVDPNDQVADCHPGNNDGASVLKLCPK